MAIPWQYFHLSVIVYCALQSVNHLIGVSFQCRANLIFGGLYIEEYKCYFRDYRVRYKNHVYRRPTDGSSFVNTSFRLHVNFHYFVMYGRVNSHALLYHCSIQCCRNIV